jgi:hypothetical protein
METTHGRGCPSLPPRHHHLKDLHPTAQHHHVSGLDRHQSEHGRGCRLDASGADTFEDWCAEYGYDTDSRKAEHIYKTVRKQTVELAGFLGPELYEALLKTERL